MRKNIKKSTTIKKTKIDNSGKKQLKMKGIITIITLQENIN